MRFILENGPSRTEAEAPDLPSALYWAQQNWAPALMRGSASKTLSPNLTINGVPLMDAVAAYEAEKARAA
jgi:hypothetical protein